MPRLADDDAMPAWQAADAERNFARLVEAAQSDPQLLLKQAEPVGIVMSVEHYRKLTAQADAEFAGSYSRRRLRTAISTMGSA